MNPKENSYYQRQLLLPEVGLKGQAKLKNAKVLVIGAGGLGCPVLQYLAAAGIGHLGIVDGDVVEMSNLHRQVLYHVGSLGKNKALEAQKILSLLNPNINIMATPVQLTPENAIEIMQGYNIVVDCSDNYETRFLVNDVAVLNNTPLVYGSIYRFEGQVSVFNYNNGPTYRCLFPQFPKSEANTNCSLAGVIGILPGIIGILQANEVIKLVLNQGEVLSGKILTYQSLKNGFEVYELRNNAMFSYAELLKGGQVHRENYYAACSNSTRHENITAEDLLESAYSHEYLVLDVREPSEEPLFLAKGVVNIPLIELSTRMNEIPTDQKIAVICKSGIRSRKAIDIFNQLERSNTIKNLDQGITIEFIKEWKRRQKK